MKRFLQISFTVIVILAMFLPGWAGGARDVQADYAAPVQTFYMTLPEGDAFTVLYAINNDAVAPIINYSSIAVGADETIVYYDQWEDGYVSDYTTMTADKVYDSTTNPAGVQVWGNGNCADGYPPNIDGANPPGGTCTGAWDALSAGNVIILNASVVIPNSSASIDYDARDKISATKSISMAHAIWADEPGTLNAFGHELYATAEWGLAYESPVGILNTNDGNMFEYSALSIMASESPTTVYIDTLGDGSDDIGPITLQEGGSYLLTGVRAGAYVHADKPIQVLLLTGETESSVGYGSRDINLLPVSAYGSSYWSPVGVANGTRLTRLFLYNPNNVGEGSIFVRCEKTGSASTQEIAPNSSVYYELTNNQAAHCYAVTSGNDSTPTSDTFFGIGTVDYNYTYYDWSFTLYPDSFLSTEALVGLGLGKDPTNAADDNGSPLWVTPACSSGGTYIYVDWNNDGTADKVDFDGDGNVTDTNVNGLNETTSQNGFLVNRLVSVRLFDNTNDAFSFDQSGARVWSRTASGAGYGGTPGCKIAVAWGEDPQTINAAAPGLDVGTTIPPLRAVEGTKTLALAIDADSDGQLSPGDTATYNITIKNAGMTTLNFSLYDTVPEHTTYVINTTYWKLGLGGTETQIPDDTPTPFPLDVDGGVPVGVPAGSLAPGETIYAWFNITLDALSTGNYYESFTNCETTYTDVYDLTRCVTTPVAAADWGDLPDTFGTSAAAFGPRHTFSPGFFLGTHIDFEPQGQPSNAADGDDLNQTTGPKGDDEDGVSNGAPSEKWYIGQGSLFVNLTGEQGCLNGWMDVNQDGDFVDDLYEKIIDNTLVTTGWQTVDMIPFPEGVVLQYLEGTEYYFRFRLTPTNGEGLCTADVLPTGIQTGGEVEDYLFDLGNPSAVDMTTFSAVVESNTIVLNWSTQEEIDNVGFNLYRSEPGQGARVKLNDALIDSLVPPGSTTGTDYSFTDETAVPGVLYKYWLEDINTVNVSRLHGPVEAQIPLAAQEMQVNFAAVGVKNVVLLTWETSNESGIQGYNLYHATSADGKQTKLNNKLIPSEVESGEVDDAVYAYIDRVGFNKNKTHYYWLEIIDSSGTAAFQGPFQAKAAQP